MKIQKLAAAVLLAALLTGCAKTEETVTEALPAETVRETTTEVTETQPQSTLRSDWYSQEQAMLAGFVVIQDGDVRHNQSRWMRYMTAVESKEPSSVTVMEYHRTEEGFTQTRIDLTFDGACHHLTRKENGEVTEKTYTQLLKQQSVLDESREPYDSVIRFLLANGEDSKVLFEDLIAETDYSGVTEIAFHLKEGEPALKTYTNPAQVDAILSLLSHSEYLFGDPEEYYYGAKLLMTNGKGEQIVIELDLNKGNYRYGMQTYCYGEVFDLLQLLGLDKWPEEVYAEHGSYIC